MLATQAKHGAAAHERTASRAACPCCRRQDMYIVDHQALVNLRKARCRYQLTSVLTSVLTGSSDSMCADDVIAAMQLDRGGRA